MYNTDTCTITVTGGQTNAGKDYTATASELSNSNYALPTANTTKFTINKASPATNDFSYSATTVTYNKDTHPVTVEKKNTINGMGSYTVVYKTNDTDWTTDAPVNAGIYQVGVRVADGTNYNATSENEVITDENWTLTINTESISYEASGYDKIYDGDAHNISVNVTSPEAVTIEYSTDGTNYSTENPTFKDAGEYTIYYRITKDNYTQVTGNTTVKIIKKTVTITPAENQSKVYGDNNPAKYDYTASGLVKEETLSGALNRKSGENAGEYAYDVTELNNTNTNYTISLAETASKFSITKKELTITAKSKTITYGDAPANDSVTYSGFVNSETSNVLGGTLAYAYSYTQYDNVGNSYTITPSGLTSDNYRITFVNGTLNVEPKVIGIDWKNTTLTYNGEAQKPTATATGLVNSDKCSIIVDGEQTDAGNNYTATASKLNNDNYALPTANTTPFTIGRATVTITAEQNENITYDTQELDKSDFIFTPEANNALAATLLTNEKTVITVKKSDTDEEIINAGEYSAKITISNPNYNDVVIDYVNVKINKAVSETTAPVLKSSLTYYGSALKLIQTEGSVTDGQGTMYYAVTKTDQAPDSASDDWTDNIKNIKADTAGTYHVWYQVQGNTNYALVPTLAGSVTVSQYTAPVSTKSYQIFTVHMDSYIYDGTAHEPTINGMPIGKVIYYYYNADTNELLNEAPSEVGNYRVRVYASGSSSCYSRSQSAEYVITNPIDENGMADVAVFKKNNIIPKAEGKVFAGWFTDSTCTKPYTNNSGRAYAKFIDEKILTVKAQISSDTKMSSVSTSIRFITSLDSLKYQNVGFKITFTSKTIDQKLTKVYSAINAGGSKVKPSVFSKESHYMGAFALNNIPNSAFGKAFTVTPYYTTQDGTVVEGETKDFTIANMIK